MRRPIYQKTRIPSKLFVKIYKIHHKNSICFRTLILDSKLKRVKMIKMVKKLRKNSILKVKSNLRLIITI